MTTHASRDRLQVQDTLQRALVRVADLLLAPLHLFSRRRVPATVRRVLLLRLERIGDLLMILDAVHDARSYWPEAEIDLAVSKWNVAIAKLIPGVRHIDVATLPWLERGTREASAPQLVTAARRWRAQNYDVVVNFEPDIRTNLLAWLSGAPVRAGYWNGGGGALLTHAESYDTAEHVSANARRLVAGAAGLTAPAGAAAGRAGGAQLSLGEIHGSTTSQMLQDRARPFIGVHVSGGRESKQWHPDRFAESARELHRRHGGTLVLTGEASDRALVDSVARQLDGLPVIDAVGALDLPGLAALLSEIDVFVTGDTGPMHLASVMGTPVVALFGPSDPRRYGPTGRAHRVLRVQLPCSPCGRVRLPPERCRGHVPDCMDGITVGMVVSAAGELLAETGRARPIG